MYAPQQSLKPLSVVQLSAEEAKMLAWMRSASWEAQPAERGQVLHKAKLPEFFGGVRLYRVQGGGPSASAHGPLDLFIKKLEYSGVIGKQDGYPVAMQGTARFLSLRKSDLDNLGVGQDADDEE